MVLDLKYRSHLRRQRDMKVYQPIHPHLGKPNEDHLRAAIEWARAAQYEPAPIGGEARLYRQDD